MRLLHLYLSVGHNFFGRHGQPAGDAPMQEVDCVRCVAGRGLEGDRFFDWKPDYKGQVTFFAIETHRDLEAKLGETGRAPWVYRRNVITEGRDLNDLIGVEFEVQGVRFFGTEEARPCYWMNEAFGPGAEEALRGWGGLRARILSDGVLRRDEAEVAG
ncbi:MAG: molybdenum cofactor biosysynthesis protein [Verrucomicrobiales bacterium]|nr:molybdenum cofactor biosysynthesis protein [Verrucomicrobiales bacterium]